MTEAAAIDPGQHQEHPGKIVWALAWPAVLLNSLQVINVLLDRAYLGRLEPAALTALGGSTNMLFLMFSLAMALGTASTALVSRAFGARQVEEFRTSARQCLSLSLVIGAVCAVGCYFAAPMAAKILPAQDKRAIELMVQFLSVYAMGLPAIFVIQSLAGSMRGVGDTKSPMVISGAQIGLHALISWLFIFPPHSIAGITIPGFNLGFVGAAIGLAASAWISAVVYIAYASRTPIGSMARMGIPAKNWARRILKIAVPAATMAVLRVASFAVFTLVLAMVPNASVAVAAMSVGFALEAIMFMPSFGLSVAAAALVGQSLGMKRPDRAEKLAWVAGHHGALVTLAISLPIFIFAPNLAHVLLPGKEAIVGETVSLIRWLCVTEVFFAYAMVMIGAMQGAGDTVRPMWISIIAMWGLRVPLAFLFALGSGTMIAGGISLPWGLGLGATGAWIAMSFTQMVQGWMSIVAFKQGKWKLKEV